jgi:hypothetical protein
MHTNPQFFCIIKNTIVDVLKIINMLDKIIRSYPTILAELV